MADRKAQSIHFGRDEQGAYFSFVDQNCAWHSININPQQEIMLLKQLTIDIADNFKAKE